MVRKKWTSASLDMGNATTQREFDLRDAITGTVQLSIPDKTSATAVVTLYRSNDGLGWVTLQDGGVTLGPGDAMTDELDFSGFLYLAARVTTAEGSAQIGTVTVVWTVEA